jgi:nucleoid-associated protein YgaU
MAPAAAGPTIDAIEIEGDRTFFAGAGPDGATLRLYVDDTYIADAVVADGRWLVEAGRVLTRPEQRVRADLLQPGSADVAARAEVDFVVDLPASDAQIAMADAPPAPSPSASVPAAPAQTTPAAPIAGVAEAPVGATTPAEPQPSPTTEVSQAAAQPGPATAATTPSQPEPSTAPAQPETGGATTEGATSAPPTSATSEDLSVPTLVAVQVGGPDAERFASGKAIIRRGDNLWTIARRVYGEGIKYTTIYDANTGQIRDPDRIYPGQVFDLPN